MSRGKPCERMSRGAKGWHGFISCTNGWGRRGVWDVCAKTVPLPRLSGRSTQQRRGVGAAPHDAPPSVKEGVGRFMTGRWGSATEAACAAEAGACEAQASRYVGLRRAYHIAPHMCVGTYDAARRRDRSTFNSA